LPLAPLREHVRQSFSASGRSLPPIITLPPSAFRAILSGVGLFMPKDIRRAIKTLPVFFDYLATEQSFANGNTSALLSTAGLTIPPPNSYLDNVFCYYLNNNK